MHWSFAIHIIGIVLWLGGLFNVTRFAGLAAEPGASLGQSYAKVLRKSWFVGVIQGLALTVLTGLYQLFAGAGLGVYFKQGWFHGKVTLVLVLVAATVMLGFEIKKIGESQAPHAGRLRVVQMLSMIGLIGIVCLTKFSRP